MGIGGGESEAHGSPDTAAGGDKAAAEDDEEAVLGAAVDLDVLDCEEGDESALEVDDAVEAYEVDLVSVRCR